MTSIPSIGLSDFARSLHRPGTGCSYYSKSESELINKIKKNWHARSKGAGERDIDAVCIVPVSSDDFVTTTIHIDNAHDLEAKVVKRRNGEDSFIEVTGNGQPIIPDNVKIVLYSREELKNDTLYDDYESPYDYEVVSIIVSDVKNEPMNPLAMARNYLEKPGGNKCDYTAEEFAKAIYYWSQRIKQKQN